MNALDRPATYPPSPPVPVGVAVSGSGTPQVSCFGGQTR